MRNRTQFRRHAVPPEPGIQPPRQARRFITIHHISSQFRIHAGGRTGAPRNSAPSLEFKTKPAVRRGLEIGFGFQNARAIDSAIGAHGKLGLVCILGSADILLGLRRFST